MSSSTSTQPTRKTSILTRVTAVLVLVASLAFVALGLRHLDPGFGSHAGIADGGSAITASAITASDTTSQPRDTSANDRDINANADARRDATLSGKASPWVEAQMARYSALIDRYNGPNSQEPESPSDPQDK